MVVLGFLRLCVVTGFALSKLPLAPCAIQIPQPTTARADSPELVEALSRSFPQADAFTTRVATLSESERADLSPRLRTRQAPRLWTYKEARKSGELLGRAIEGDVIGKELPITFLVLLTRENSVRGIEILNYRETHGGEVRREKWRAQFNGKSAGDSLKLGEDIKNIAGATLSCRALTDAVHDALGIAAVVFAAAADDPTSTRSLPVARCVAPPSPEVFDRVQLLMGTLLELRVLGADRAQFDAAADGAFARVAQLEALWSTWRADSEVSRLNTAEPGVWCPLSQPTLALLARARDVRVASAEAFAVEIGPLVELWQSAETAQRDPSAERVASARAACACSAFEIDAAHSRARRTIASAKLDLGGIGKGAALDEVAREFRARGLTRALFDFGGQLLALDGPREGDGWPIEVRDPRPNATGPLWEMELKNASLATSSDDQRGLVIAGLRRSHIVDPRTGSPANLHWAACAWASSATDADAWSTAAFILEHDACASVASMGEVRLLTLEHDGRVWTSASFPGRRRNP